MDSSFYEEDSDLDKLLLQIECYENYENQNTGVTFQMEIPQLNLWTFKQTDKQSNTQPAPAAPVNINQAEILSAHTNPEKVPNVDFLDDNLEFVFDPVPELDIHALGANNQNQNIETPVINAENFNKRFVQNNETDRDKFIQER